MWLVLRWVWSDCDWGLGGDVGSWGVGFSARWFLRIEVRLGRLADRQDSGTGDGACDVYPPRLVTVVRERCSAGRMRDGGCGVGRSSGCGCAGSLRVLCFLGGLGK